MSNTHKPNTHKPNTQSDGLDVCDLRASIGSRRILSGVSFQAPTGAVTGLLGPNGAGKTTVLRACLGLVPELSGVITLNGTALADLSIKDRARRIAYLPQGSVVHWPITVENLVALGRLPHGQRPAHLQDVMAIDAAIQAADVAHLRERPVTHLSGGERTRVLLARALATDADILFADEPVAMLDPLHVLTVMDVFAKLAASGKTVVVVLHDLALAVRYCHHAVLINNGATVTEGPPMDVLSDVNLRQVYGVSLVGTIDATRFEVSPP